jgi:16S rRNA (cytosine1402-N4)-methyltransferase
VFEHASVLAAEVIDGLNVRPGCVYVDGTLGGGGHAAVIEAKGGTVIGIDRDPAALEAARIQGRKVHARYSEMAEIIGQTTVDGILLDLGVSSPQLDHADRGFSFNKEGPLDMRMDPTRGPTAADLIQETDADALADLIFELGEERFAKRVARAIKDAGEIPTTTKLAAIISGAIPFAEQRKSRIHPATRTFQALRIAVNAELTELETFLDVFPGLLSPGGRCAIISFHSLEDRLVKIRFRDLAWTSSLPPQLAREAGERVDAVCEPITKKPIVATEAEIERNPRARSAKLRICERTTADNLPAR